MTIEQLDNVNVELVEQKSETEHVVIDIGGARLYISHTEDYNTAVVVNGAGEKEQASVILGDSDEIDGILHGPDTPARYSEYRIPYPHATM